MAFPVGGLVAQGLNLTASDASEITPEEKYRSKRSFSYTASRRSRQHQKSFKSSIFLVISINPLHVMTYGLQFHFIRGALYYRNVESRNKSSKSSISMNEFVTPKQVARAIQVSESSVKRWCDKGVIPTQKTAGGHRRIQLAGLVRFLRESGQVLARPEVIGLPATTG